jgi:sterol desaturase/sphingolipid hydroxylase (fatty acid hydroxylase superfamily)
VTKVLVLLAVFIVLSVVFGVLQRLWPGVRGQSIWRTGIKTDFLWWFFDPLIGQGAAFAGIVLAVLAVCALAGVPLDRQHISEYANRNTAIGSQPAIVQLFEALLWFDLIGYWSHRAFHRVGLLWRYHAVHHSSTELDWLSSVRVHPVNEIGTRIAQAIPLVLVGYSPKILAAYIPLLTLYAIFLHANLSWNFGKLRYVIASPVFHRWHHTTEKEGIDRNFGGMFPWLDMLFGTLYFPADRQPMVFGVLNEQVPNNLWKQLLYPFQKKQSAQAASLEA